MTAEQVLRRARRELPDISPATVYNTLHELTELGMLNELDLGLGMDQRRYEIVAEEHDHLICLRCGRIEDVRRQNGMASSPEDHHDFDIVDRRVIYLGYCPDCVSDVEVQ